MPTRAPLHRPAGWSPAPVQPRRRDAVDQSYGRQAWRNRAAEVVQRAGGKCFVCSKPGATIAHHLIEKRAGGSDDFHNLVAVHHACHERLHGKRGG